MITLLSSPLTLMFFFLMKRHPPRSTLFPYTTLFRSEPAGSPSREPTRLSDCAVRALERIGQNHLRAIGIEQRYPRGDRKSTRLNSSHSQISYAVFCLKKKNEHCARPTLHASERPPTP